MNHSICRALVIPLLLCVMMSACTRFEPVPFPIYKAQDYPYQVTSEDLTFSAGTFTQDEVKRYFASDLVKKNIWPVRAMIENSSSKTYLFSKGMIKPEATTSLEAARRGRRSAGHRLFWGYVFISSFFGIPIGVPLVVGGFQAMSANSYMETDYRHREIRDGEIKAGETITGILFFHRPDLPSAIEVALLEAITDNKLILNIDMAKVTISPTATLGSQAAVRPDMLGKVELS